jgi:hypothetical protein
VQQHEQIYRVARMPARGVLEALRARVGDASHPVRALACAHTRSRLRALAADCSLSRRVRPSFAATCELCSLRAARVVASC